MGKHLPEKSNSGNIALSLAYGAPSKLFVSKIIEKDQLEIRYARTKELMSHS